MGLASHICHSSKGAGPSEALLVLVLLVKSLIRDFAGYVRLYGIVVL